VPLLYVEELEERGGATVEEIKEDDEENKESYVTKPHVS